MKRRFHELVQSFGDYVADQAIEYYYPKRWEENLEYVAVEGGNLFQYLWGGKYFEMTRVTQKRRLSRLLVQGIYRGFIPGFLVDRVIAGQGRQYGKRLYSAAFAGREAVKRVYEYVQKNLAGFKRLAEQSLPSGENLRKRPAIVTPEGTSTNPGYDHNLIEGNRLEMGGEAGGALALTTGNTEGAIINNYSQTEVNNSVVSGDVTSQRAANVYFSKHYRGSRDKAAIAQSRRAYNQVTMRRILNQSNVQVISGNVTKSAGVGKGLWTTYSTTYEDTAGYMFLNFLCNRSSMDDATAVPLSPSNWADEAFHLRMPGVIVGDSVNNRYETALMEGVMNGAAGMINSYGFSVGSGMDAARWTLDKVVNPDWQSAPVFNATGGMRMFDDDDFRYVLGEHCAVITIANPMDVSIEIELSFVEPKFPETVSYENDLMNNVIANMQTMKKYENGSQWGSAADIDGSASAVYDMKWYDGRYHMSDFYWWRRNMKEWNKKRFTIGAGGKVNIITRNYGDKIVSHQTLNTFNRYANLTHTIMIRFISAQVWGARTGNNLAELVKRPVNLLMSVREDVTFYPYTKRHSKTIDCTLGQAAPAERTGYYAWNTETDAFETST